MKKIKFTYSLQYKYKKQAYLVRCLIYEDNTITLMPKVGKNFNFKNCDINTLKGFKCLFKHAVETIEYSLKNE